MIESLRTEYYWGDFNREIFLFDYNDLSDAIYKLWDAKDKESVKRIFEASLYEYEGIYDLIESIILEYVNNPGRLELINTFEEDLRKIDIMDTEWYHWDMLRRVLSGINAQYFAWICRNIEEDILMNNEARRHSLLLRKYSMLVTRDNWDSANRIFQELKNSELKEKWGERYLQILDYDSTIQGRKALNDDYGEFLNNKRAVIMGVAPHNQNEKTDIDNTIHIFINYFSKERMAYADRLVSTDVSYYNYESSLKAINDYKCLSDLDYMVCKNLRGEFKENINGCRIRNMHSMMFGCPFGHPLMIPIIVFDLLHYKNDGVHITHTNFYCSDKPYYDGYCGEDAVKELLIGLSSHDLFGNWLLMQTWHRNGLFTCDRELKDVLGQSEEEYVVRLEKSFGIQLKGR